MVISFEKVGFYFCFVDYIIFGEKRLKLIFILIFDDNNYNIYKGILNFIKFNFLLYVIFDI